MKRRIALVFLIAAVIFNLPSCKSSPKNIYGLIKTLSDSFSEEKGAYILYADSEQAGFSVLDGKDLGRLYIGRWEEPSCFSRISGYAIRLPLDDSGFELHALKCVNLSDTEEISRLIRKRIDRLQNAEIKEYAPESYERYFVGAEIFVWGDTVFLLATPDNLSVKRQIKRA